MIVFNTAAAHRSVPCLVVRRRFCPKLVQTYNSVHYDGIQAQGGYSTHIIVKEDFTLRVPQNLDLQRVAPLLCAGITTYTPLVEHGLNKPGKKVGVVGLGGLGHMAVKLAAAMGAEVTVLSRSKVSLSRDGAWHGGTRLCIVPGSALHEADLA